MGPVARSCGSTRPVSFFVMSATNTGADKRARSKIQVLNGSIDVLESIDEVSQALKTNDSVS